MRSPTLSELPPPPPGKNGWPWTEDCPQLPDKMPDGSHWPRVTIVTPSLNQCRFIEETIRSVLLQRYPNLEYIIIDGGSNDGSIEIIRKYEKHLSYWTSEPDEGQSDAINKGWRRGTGEITAWLNSDDTYHPGAIWKAVKAFLVHTNAAMVYGACVLIDEFSAPFAIQKVPHFDPYLMLRSCSNLIPSPIAFMRREVLNAIGMLKVELHYSMDYELFLRIGLCWPVIYVPGLIANQRVHRFAKSSCGSEQSALEVLEIVRQTYSSLGATKEIKAACTEGIAVGHVRTALQLYNKGLRWRALGMRVKACKYSLRGLFSVPPGRRKAMLSLLFPGRLLPWLRRGRADTDSTGLIVIPVKQIDVAEGTGN